ncbi:aminoglycoside phosphotransferase family protein [Rhodovibrio salinarum]|nr:phosphotransferase [Rhodovibrio salinarum]
MPAIPDRATLTRQLRTHPRFADLGADELTPMAVKGLAHEHLRVGQRGWVLRVPKQSQFAFGAQDNLTYQAACFERVSASGHAPRLAAVLTPSEELPMGALVVEEIVGRPPRLPDDLPALAAAMARVHHLPVPSPMDRPPLADHSDPVAGAMAEITAQAEYLDAADLDPAAREELEAELDWARAFAARVEGAAQPIRLVLTDTHPGNFLITDDGKAVIVDLEKALYGSPGTDLAHATLYSSTTWDPDTYADLSLDALGGYYSHYLEAVGPELAQQLRPWLVPLRRITFLRALTWCVMWSVEHRRAARTDAAGHGRDWSADNTDPALIAHVADRVAEYLRPETLRRMRAEWLAAPGLAAEIGD